MPILADLYHLDNVPTQTLKNIPYNIKKWQLKSLTILN